MDQIVWEVYVKKYRKDAHLLQIFTNSWVRKAFCVYRGKRDSRFVW